MNITNSIQKYTTTNHYKKFKESNPIWGYTIMRTKNYKQECVLKFVQPSSKGKSETTKYPPGPGNVCTENNRASRLDNLLKLIEVNYPEIEEVANQSTMTSKKNICCLLELIFRYKDRSFYPYDKIWLKYY